MKVTAIMAIGQNGELGNKGKLPWKLKGELLHFWNKVGDDPFIVGRKTLDSMAEIEHETFYLISKDTTLGHTIREALLDAKTEYYNLFIIGGKSIYEQTMPLWDEIHLTVVHSSFEHDCALNLDVLNQTLQNFKTKSESTYLENGLKYTIYHLIKK